jgi:hypothetical protein
MLPAFLKYLPSLSLLELHSTDSRKVTVECVCVCVCVCVCQINVTYYEIIPGNSILDVLDARRGKIMEEIN